MPYLDGIQVSQAYYDVYKPTMTEPKKIDYANTTVEVYYVQNPIRWYAFSAVWAGCSPSSLGKQKDAMFVTAMDARTFLDECANSVARNKVYNYCYTGKPWIYIVKHMKKQNRFFR